MGQSHNLSAGSEEDKHDITEFLSVLEPAGKHAAKCTIIIASALVFNSLGAIASETTGQVKEVAKAAKSAKATGKVAKKILNYSTAIAVCGNAGVKAEEAYKGMITTPTLLLTLNVILLCGFALSKAVYEK